MTTLNVKKLRIGNWINLGLLPEIHNYGRVLSIGSEKQEFEQVYCECAESLEWAFKDNYLGIPLTEEILAKSGAQKIAHRYTYDDLTLREEPYFNLGWFELHSVSTNQPHLPQWQLRIGGRFLPRSFPYLHELQNFYYSLMDRELEIQLL